MLVVKRLADAVNPAPGRGLDDASSRETPRMPLVFFQIRTDRSDAEA